ncbi:hypothetical protein QQ045_027611 [Rhodiola kirilowii]
MLDHGAAAPSPAFSDSDEMSAFLRQILLRSANQCNSPASQTPHVEQNPSFQLQPVSELPISELEEYDCPSEAGLEALVEEASKRRRSSKRRRAADVHNMSEKRRRSRINEKMKALQDLIPNSNKTDKASMLDEAIEYLKQLQLQVQMLTLRNQLILHPMCLPKSSMLDASNVSPAMHKLDSSSLGDLFTLHMSSDLVYNSMQMNPH